MKDQLQKAMDIARKTGDRLIIFDTAKTKEAYVVMSLDEYEKNVFNTSEDKGVASLTEDELLDKINCDIAEWKSEKEERLNKERKLSNFRRNYGRLMDYEDVDDEEFEGMMDEMEDYKDEFEAPLEPINEDDNEFEINANNRRKNWRIPTDRKKAAEEIIEEDRQYLEEI